MNLNKIINDFSIFIFICLSNKYKCGAIKSTANNKQFLFNSYSCILIFDICIVFI